MKKRLLSGLVLLALLQCLMLPAFAEPTDAPADPTEPSASETAADPTDAPIDGTEPSTIRAGKELHGAVHRVIPDRMAGLPPL